MGDMPTKEAKKREFSREEDAIILFAQVRFASTSTINHINAIPFQAAKSILGYETDILD